MSGFNSGTTVKVGVYFEDEIEAETSLRYTLSMLLKNHNKVVIVNALQELLREENEMIEIQIWDDDCQLNY